MRITRSFDTDLENMATVWNRSGQLEHDLTEFCTQLDALETAAADLTQRIVEFQPAPVRHTFHGGNIVDPNVDTRDPSVPLAVLKERLRRTSEKLERVNDLVGQARGTIARIVG